MIYSSRHILLICIFLIFAGLANGFFRKNNVYSESDISFSEKSDEKTDRFISGNMTEKEKQTATKRKLELELFLKKLSSKTSGSL